MILIFRFSVTSSSYFLCRSHPSLLYRLRVSRSHSHRHPMTFAANVANLTVHTLSDRCQTCQNPHYQPRPRLSRTFFLKSEFKSHRTFALYRTAFLALWSLLLFLPALPPCSSSFAVSPFRASKLCQSNKQRKVLQLFARCT